MERTYKTYPVRSGIAAVLAVSAAGLAIAGLAGLVPGLMAAIATIALGIVLVSEGRAFAVRTPDRNPSTESGSRWRFFQGTTVTESVSGLVGTMLGVLALLSVVRMELLPIALIVFGLGILMEGGSMGIIPKWRYAEQERNPDPGESGDDLPSLSFRASVGIDMLAGIAGIGLGILALVGIAPITLVLVSLFVLGFTLTVNSMVLSREFPTYGYARAHSH
jgi:hypothetical protein